jgi:hypothetical protein
VKTQEESNELHSIDDASMIGDLITVHAIYSGWFAKQRPEPNVGAIDKARFNFTVHLAAANGQPATLAYFLSQGFGFDRDLIKAAVLSKSAQVLQVLLDHAWNINEPESYCDPPYLGYV